MSRRALITLARWRIMSTPIPRSFFNSSGNPTPLSVTLRVRPEPFPTSETSILVALPCFYSITHTLLCNSVEIRRSAAILDRKHRLLQNTRIRQKRIFAHCRKVRLKQQTFRPLPFLPALNPRAMLRLNLSASRIKSVISTSSSPILWPSRVSSDEQYCPILG